MKQHHPLLNSFIFRKLSESGLTRKELCAKAGYANIEKGLRTLEEFKKTGHIHSTVLQNIITALKIDVNEINQNLLKERIISKENLFEDWKNRVKLPDSETRSCTDCPFFSKGQKVICAYPFNGEKEIELFWSRNVGYWRPRECPVV